MKNPEYSAIVILSRQCEKCCGDMRERMRCGCVWRHEVGSYPTIDTARVVAHKVSRRTGLYCGGHTTWSWEVRREGKVVAASSRMARVWKRIHP